VIGDVFERWAARIHAPGLAWGLVRDGALVDGGGIGTARVGLDAPVDPDVVFRIASMTKSFTAAALMSLVVEGRVRLDEPAATYVPPLAAWRGPTTDGPPITVRHLVSMEAGLPNDDPWADRHNDMGAREMDALLEAGAVFAWTPGVRFEYANLGWGLVGRVIEAAAGVTTQDLVRTRLLEPLGMTSTTWTRPDGRVVAEPYRWVDGDWVHDGEPVGDGAIAPMGGLWSTVRDLATWVGFFQDAWPPRDDPDDGPLPRWARREMQQLRRVDDVRRARPRPDGPSRDIAVGYGIGLGVRHDPRLGHVVGHSGGLPGYGSHMRWLPERGVGVVALSNVTYGAMSAACDEALDVLADRDGLGPGRPPDAPALREAATRAAALLSAWSDERADALFTDNVALDEPYDRRAREAADLVARHGPLEVDEVEPETPLRGAFTAAGGLVRVDLAIAHDGRVQWLEVADRSTPSDEPVIADPKVLREAAGTAYVVLRPTGDLADAFVRWQGEVLDRLGGARATVPAAHATVKAFGSSSAPLTDDDLERIREVVEDWASATAPIDLRAVALDVFEGDEAVPVVRLAPIPALADLWARAAAAGLPGGYSDAIGADGWIAHLSLAYPVEPEPARWAELVAWARGVDVGDLSCTVATAELLVFDGGPERRRRVSLRS
jgi:CubicO group peptidase (beta-lactamase class C family)